jgi:type VI secretion system protein ImpC
VGDYSFDHTPPDVEILQGMGQIAASAHAPFIAGAQPKLMNMDSWRELADPRDLTKIFQTADYAPWRSLRESEDSRYIGLTMPRYLSRIPYGSKTNPVEDFAFEEDTGNADHNKYCWSNAAYAMAVNINRSYKMYGWCTRIRGVESGGVVESLPCHTFPTDDGGVDMKCPTEIAITDRREKELADLGLVPLVHCKGTDYAAFFSVQSAQKPKMYDKEAANANARLSAQLPYILAVSRFAHYMKTIMRDKIGSFMSRSDCERFLNRWVMQYVTEDDNAAPATKAQYPLREARVEVAEIPGKPGCYRAVAFLRPHFQLDELTVSLRLVAELPASARK